jgi:hypothetical protein
MTLRAWEFGLSSAASVARLGLELLDAAGSDSGSSQRPRSAPASFDNGRPADVVDVEPLTKPQSRTVSPPPREADSPPAVPDELIPDHVDEEVVLVAEVAEEGAEGGAGPELHVDEPWDGYDQMTAPQIRDRLTAGTVELAAAVELYESIGKARRTVLEAAERTLKQ